ncbi:MAG TPA: head GIN domain-containing protein [Steroidobacteraceae bacterium]|nr:head GIN domain-containing protein [Steroidobacteraceae bacterium]
MSTTRLRSACSLLLGTVLLAACSGPSPGPTRSESRSVEPFHAIELRGNGEARITVGKPQAVTLTAGENALPDIITRVDKGILIVEHMKGTWYQRPELKVQIDVPAIDSIAANGALIVSMEGMTGPRLALTLGGAGTLRASGQVGAMDVRLGGAGKMELAGLRADDASVSVNGTGSIEVQVTGQLEATVNGVGSITYAGNPREVVRHVNGVGTIAPSGSPSP